MVTRRTWTENLAIAALTLAGSIGLNASAAFGAQGVATNEEQSAAPAPGSLQAGLDEAAARLQIKASQEPEWKDFTAALKAMAATAAQPGALAAAASEKGNGAALLQLSAERTMSRAQALEKLATAASKLQNVLDPDQREVFEEIVRMRLEPYAMRLRGHGYAPWGWSAQQDAAIDPPGGAGGSRGGGGGFRGGGGGGFRGGGGGGFRGGGGGGFRGGAVQGGFRGRFYGAGFPGWWWGPGWFGLDLYLATLPWYYETYWWDNVPYYYADGDYYAWNGDVGEYEQVQPPPQIAQQGPGQAPAAGNRLFVYPKNGQTEQQQSKDESQCSSWASSQTGYTPATPATGTAANENGSAALAKGQDYLRAYGACLEARGYSIG